MQAILFEISKAHQGLLPLGAFICPSIPHFILFLSKNKGTI